jgi:hypothetical protein
MVETIINKLNRRDKSMKSIIILFAGMFIVGSTACSQPKLSIAKTHVDLDTVYSGIPKKGKFEYKNIGNDTLRVNIQPTCGCTIIKSQKKYLSPNESDIVEFEFHSTSPGKVEKDINISSNDPTLKNTSVKFTAMVVSALTRSDRLGFWMIQDVRSGESKTDKSKFINTSGQILTIKGVTTSTPSILQAEIEKKKLKPSDSIEVKIIFKPEKVGFARERIFIETDSKNQPKVEFNIFCSVIQGDKK